MARPVILHSGPWTDLPLEELALKAGDWGYQGLELACWGDHCEVQRALSEDDYCQHKLDLLARFDLTVPAVNNLRVGQAVSDPIDRRHQPLLPDYVWGDGKPAGVRQRAAEEMVATVRAAQKLGAAIVSGFTGSPLWSFVAGYPPLTPALLEAGLADFVRQWAPILDVCQECGIKFACEVSPGQMAFDLASAEQVLEALGGREEFGFALAPGQLLWQGVDPVEFVRRFPERIYHVHVADVALTLNGRAGLLNGYALPGVARRGWDYRSPGHGGVDWAALVRVLNEVGYEGPLAVDWSDPGMDRVFGAEDACRFVKRLDFEPGPRRVL
jgi:sugar phosphate isomerase/epimerase